MANVSGELRAGPVKPVGTWPPVIAGPMQLILTPTRSSKFGKTIEVMQRLPVPEWDTPFESLVRLRRNPAFRSALNDPLEWKREKGYGYVPGQDESSIAPASAISAS